MSFNPDNYDLKKLSEYPEILFGNDLPDEAFFPVVSLNDQQALVNFKISLAKLRDFIIQVGDYTNVIDYRPETYYSLDGMQLTIPGGWRLEVPNGFLPTGEYKNEILNITDDRVIDFGQQGAGKWVVTVTADQTYICAQSQLLVRKTRDKVIAPATGVECIESTTNTWWRWTGTDWQQLIGMPLLNVESDGENLTVTLCNSLMRNRLNLEYLLAQSGIEIPESRAPFERIITNVKKSGAALLYYIPAHTEVDLTNYPETLDLIRSAYNRAVAADVKSFTLNDIEYQFYRDDETGLDFAFDLTTYSTHYDNFGIAPFIYYDGDTHIWTPKTSHGELIYEAEYGANPISQATENYKVRIYADGWIELCDVLWPVAQAICLWTLPFEMRDTTYNFQATGSWELETPPTYGSANARVCTICGKTLTTVSFMITALSAGSTARINIKLSGWLSKSAMENIPNSDSHHEYYLLGNAATNIPVDLSGQLATILNAYNQIVQQGVDFFSIQATDSADALAKSIVNPNKFVYVAEPES